MAKNRLGGLGKGLDALFADNTGNEGSVTLPISEIEPNRDQPRKQFSQESLAELADSIREHGVLQPLLVRPTPNGRYQLVAGERRWRAARMAGETNVPVLIREMTDREMMELALIENLQREDLNPIEEAMGYRQLMEVYNLTQEHVAQAVGKSRSSVANVLRLLHLPDDVLSLVRDGSVSAGHARALLALEDPQLIRESAAKVIADKLTVRDIERQARKRKKSACAPEETVSLPSPIPEFPESQSDHSYRELELALMEELGRRVSLRPRGTEGAGSLSIDFFDTQDLCDLISRLTGQPCSL